MWFLLSPLPRQLFLQLPSRYCDNIGGAHLGLLQERTCCSAVKSAVSWQPLAVNTLKPTLPFELRPCSSWDSPQPMAKHRVGAKPGHFFQHGTPLMSNLCSGIPHWVDQNLLRSAFWSEALSNPAFFPPPPDAPCFFFFLSSQVLLPNNPLTFLILSKCQLLWGHTWHHHCPREVGRAGAILVR